MGKQTLKLGKPHIRTQHSRLIGNVNYTKAFSASCFWVSLDFIAHKMFKRILFRSKNSIFDLIVLISVIVATHAWRAVATTIATTTSPETS